MLAGWILFLKTLATITHMDNPRLFLFLALFMSVFMIWQAWQVDYASGPSPAIMSNSSSQPADAGSADGSSANNDDLPEPAEHTSNQQSATSAQAVDSEAEQAPSQRIRVTTDVFNIEIDTRGGDIRKLALPTYPVSSDKPQEPFVLLQDDQRLYVAQSGLLHDVTRSDVDLSQLAPSHHALYTAEQQSYELKEGVDELQVMFTWHGESGITVNKIYTFKRGKFLIELKHEISNQGDQAWSGRQYQQLRHDEVRDSDKSKFIHTYTGAAYFDTKYEKIKFEDMVKSPLNKTVEGGWVAMLQHYFSSAWIASGEGGNDFYSRTVNSSSGLQYIIGMRSQPITVQPGGTAEFDTELFAGPNLQGQMEEASKGMELLTDYGIFTVISKPLFWLLSKIHGVINNWGWSIIILTFLIKLVFYKLSETSYRSMARMRSVQPKLVSLKERYVNDKPKMNQALMELYKKEKINPLGGCLPIVVQIPVFISLYWVLLESVELRQADFMLWIHDLSVKDPYFVLPLLMGITMLAQQKLNPAPLDPVQAKVMMIMPFAFTIFFAFFPSGLVLYWFVNNLLSITQQWVITKRVEQAAKRN